MKKLLALIAALILTVSAYAQIEAPVKWGYFAKRISATEAVVLLKATIQPGWHIYGLDIKSGGPIKTEFNFEKSKDYSIIGKATGPKPAVKYDPNFKMNIATYEKEVIFQQKIKLKTANATTIKGTLSYMVCNNLKCLPPEDVNFTVALAK